jgi:chromosome partitioning protein
VQALREHRRSVEVAVIGLVGMRKEHTLSNEQLHQYLDTLPCRWWPAARHAELRAAGRAHGLTLWDVAPSRVERDLEQWQPVLQWAR